ncbi:hypothetical protein ABZ372_05385 [Streptomyces sp. NPDC005921]
MALLVTKRKDDTDAARTFYLRGLECLDELAEPGVDAQVERAWILNGLALAAAIDARETSDAERRDRLFQSAFELEFDAFRMVREMPGDSAFYLRYNLSHNLAFLLQITGRHRQAEEFLRSVSATMLGTGRPEFFVPHHYAIAVLQLRRGSHEEAAASFAAAVRVAHSLRDPFHLEKLLAAAGYTDLRRGDHPGAARHYRDAARTARRLCDETAFAQDLAGLLWALTLQGARWDRHTLAAARIWYPEAAGAYDRGAGRDELADALTAAGADIAPPSSKLPSYLPAVDLEGLPGRDLNRFLAGITTRENPSALLTQNTAEGTGRAGEAPETGGPERGWAAAREAARPGDVVAREAADPDAAVAQRVAGPDGAVAWGAAAPSAVTAREVADPGAAVAQRVAGPDGRVARGLASPGEAVAREPASPDTAVAREPASPDTAVAREPAVPGVTVVDGVSGSGRVVVGGGRA